jgi:hypothetical protein
MEIGNPISFLINKSLKTTRNILHREYLIGVGYGLLYRVHFPTIMRPLIIIKYEIR